MEDLRAVGVSEYRGCDLSRRCLREEATSFKITYHDEDPDLKNKEESVEKKGLVGDSDLIK